MFKICYHTSSRDSKFGTTSVTSAEMFAHHPRFCHSIWEIR